MAVIIAGSALCPDAYRGKPSDVLIAYEHGAALGLSWMQALANIAVINGRPGIYGDLIPALILATGECTRFHSPMPSDADTEAVCIIGRKGFPDEFKTTFSIADAKKAGLWDKKGPWSNYPKRMLQMRARAFCARDAFPDKLMGLGIVEELMDYPTIDAHVVSSEVVDADGPEVKALLSLPEGLQERIEKGFTACSLTNGKRRALLKQFLLEPEKDAEEQALALLAWLEDEYAKRKTGQPVKRKPKGGGNGKSPTAHSDAAQDTAGDVRGGGGQHDHPAASAGGGSDRGAVTTAGSAAPAAPVKAQPDDSLF